MIPSISLGVLFASMICGKLYPKATIIVFTIIALLVLAYPIIRNVQAAGLCYCQP